jgi:hypothetical protein
MHSRKKFLLPFFGASAQAQPASLRRTTKDKPASAAGHGTTASPDNRGRTNRPLRPASDSRLFISQQLWDHQLKLME